MPIRKRSKSPGELDALVADVQRTRATREEGYREQALKLFPHVCGRCGREFAGKNLRELTVHHKDNDHFNNPPDGSNWELLCIYCHEYEHQAPEQRSEYTQGRPKPGDKPSLGYRAFEGLKDLIQPEADESDSSAD